MVCAALCSTVHHVYLSCKNIYLSQIARVIPYRTALFIINRLCECSVQFLFMLYAFYSQPNITVSGIYSSANSLRSKHRANVSMLRTTRKSKNTELFTLHQNLHIQRAHAFFLLFMLCKYYASETLMQTQMKNMNKQNFVLQISVRLVLFYL